MTDKQITFDDVDVKDCIAYAKSQEIYLGNTLYKQMEKVCLVKNQPCKFFDCQFKQMARELKAKEQECEKKSWEIGNLGYKIKNQRKEINIRLEQIDQLKAENDELKVRNIKYMNGNIGYQLKNSLYKHTLTEIREIAETCMELNDCTKYILQKISEVEDADKT